MTQTQPTAKAPTDARPVYVIEIIPGDDCCYPIEVGRTGSPRRVEHLRDIARRRIAGYPRGSSARVCVRKA